MLRPMLAFVLTTPLAVAGSLTAPMSAAAPPGAQVVEAVHTLAVSAVDEADTTVSSYPEFSPEIDRYAVVGGQDKPIRVQAATNDPAGTVLVNGVPQGPAADVTVPGVAGQEISVIFRDPDATDVHSLFVAPTGFPTLAAETEPGAVLTPGQVLLTLSNFAGGPFFETAVDRRGVPTHVYRSERSSLDLKRQPNGDLTSHRQAADDTALSGAPVVAFDDEWQPTGETYRTVGLENTDPHDSILYPDGSRIMLAYETRDANTVDSIAQEIGPDGTEVFRWDSGADNSSGDPQVDRQAESMVPGNPDYAHVNSIVVMADGHWLLSFRHLSAVFKIARFDDGVHQAGDVIWRLGGRLSNFDFVNDPHGGPCAQHTASELPNGNIMIYDNGGGQLGNNASLCVNPANRDGSGAEPDRVNRPSTRITEYELDEQAGTATLVSSFEPEGRFAYFAGGVEQFPNGHRIIGWASSKVEVATELDTDKQSVLWTLRDTQADVNQRLFTYRADVTEIPDTIAPTIDLEAPTTVLQGSAVPHRWSASDRGGSNLVTATVTGASDGLLDTTTAGTHTVTVTAVDGAGNETVKSAAYQVSARSQQPDAMVRAGGSGWRGEQSYAAPKRQQVTLRLRATKRGTATIKVVNRGNVPGRFRITGADSTRWFSLTYRQGSRNVTGKVTGKGLRTPVLAPGESWTGKVVVHRLRGTSNGKLSRFVVRAASEDQASQRDAVRLTVRARP